MFALHITMKTKLFFSLGWNPFATYTIYGFPSYLVCLYYKQVIPIPIKTEEENTELINELNSDIFHVAVVITAKYYPTFLSIMQGSFFCFVSSQRNYSVSEVLQQVIS